MTCIVTLNRPGEYIIRDLSARIIARFIVSSSPSGGQEIEMVVPFEHTRDHVMMKTMEPTR